MRECRFEPLARLGDAPDCSLYDPRDARLIGDTKMADPMKIRANVVGDSTEVKVLMSHEMETGQRKDAQGKPIPAWFIQNVTATHNGKTVLAAQWGPAIAKNPFLSFKFKGGAKGDKVQITWTDNKGDKRSDEATIG
jgi:sulfur-oxidizing protein SoxZ